MGYLNNINSDRALIVYCSDSLDIRWFLRYDIDEALPWHITISRTRQLYGEEVFLSLFQQVLSLCVNKSMVKGKRQAINSAFIKANASLDSLIEKPILDEEAIKEDVSTYCDELNNNSECLPHILKQNIRNLRKNGIVSEQILADTGYSSGEALAFCQQRGIDAYIPNFGQYKYQREGFEYNEVLDQYECTRGNKAIVPYRKIVHDKDGNYKKVYRSINSKCKDCPLRSQCIGKSDFKKIEHTTHKPLYDAMHEKLQTPYAKKIMKKRGSTVEPVLGTMLNFLNLKRVNTRGIKGANKHPSTMLRTSVLMSTMVYILKKHLKFKPKNVQEATQILPKMEKSAAFFKRSFQHSNKPF